ncbi:MAG TPA: hypothetical protein GX510_02790 [Firmicutes bacterium]|nr:hypothetical protein [Candidatus Fermentithermobacillaceae bacterium]
MNSHFEFPWDFCRGLVIFLLMGTMVYLITMPEGASGVGPATSPGGPGYARPPGEACTIPSGNTSFPGENGTGPVPGNGGGINGSGENASNAGTTRSLNSGTDQLLADVRRDEARWLSACQHPDGAIAMAPGSDRVVPYFANLAAITLVRLDPSKARQYITWYLDHLNDPDRWGLAGTIYDFHVKDGKLVPTGNYDSADSYASTFLSLVSAYYRETKDARFVRNELNRIRKVSGVVLSLQDKDGLVRVKPGSQTKYLMDNCENYAGLMDWAKTLEALGETAEASLYREKASLIKQGIQSVLYDPSTGKYAWSLSRFGKRYPKQGKWYPDGVSQLSLISCGIIEPGSPEARTIWADFNSQFPGWEEGVKKDSFPWGVVAITAYTMSDLPRAERYIKWVLDQYASAGREYPWYVLESACLIQLCDSVPVRSSEMVLAGSS